MRVSARSRRLRPIDIALWALGIGCLAWYGLVGAEAWLYQRSMRTVLEQMRAANASAEHSAHPGLAKQLVGPGDPVGFLEIPRLNVSLAVVNGDDDETLRIAVGHLPDTPMPWEPGNSGLAGHRDTFFRPLEKIRVDDDVRVVTARGDFLYRVRRTMIVRPDDVWVLAPASQSSLTLVTCYPFTYTGHAPRRFIVQADLVAQPLS